MILRRRGSAPDYVPPISVVLAADKERYINGLIAFREARENEWLENFAVSSARAADLATRYVDDVRALQDERRNRAASLGVRSDPLERYFLDLGGRAISERSIWGLRPEPR